MVTVEHREALARIAESYAPAAAEFHAHRQPRAVVLHDQLQLPVFATTARDAEPSTLLA
jgi:hypothetical protein